MPISVPVSVTLMHMWIYNACLSGKDNFETYVQVCVFLNGDKVE